MKVKLSKCARRLGAKRSASFTFPEKRSLALRRLFWNLVYPGEPVPPGGVEVEVVTVDEHGSVVGVRPIESAD